MNETEKHQFNAMKSFSREFDDMPDGAFFALAEDMYDWTVDDWVWYSEQREKPKKHKQKAL